MIPFPVFATWKKAGKQRFYLFLSLVKTGFSSLALTVFTALELTEGKKNINIALAVFLLADELYVPGVSYSIFLVLAT